MRKLFYILLLLLLLPALTSAAEYTNHGNVKTNADLSKERLQHLQNPGTAHVLEAAKPSAAEKALYKFNIADLDDGITIQATLDASTLVCAKTKDGRIKIKDVGKDHKLRDIRVKYDDLRGIQGVSDGYVKLTHYNDAGLPDAVWVQQIINNGGYAYFKNVPFSEIVIGGWVGTYEKTGTIEYQASNTLGLGSTFKAESVNFMTAEIEPVYTKSSPYDIPIEGLIGWWKFDENTGTNVSDSSGDGNHGTATGMTWTDGKYNSAGNFDGVDDYVGLGSSDTIKPVNAISIYAVFTPQDIGAQKDVFRSGYSGGSKQGVLFYIGSDNLIRLTVGNGTVLSTAIISESIIVNQTYYITGVYDGTKPIIYKNGIKISEGEIVTTPIVYGVGNPRISTVSPSAYNGTIDNVILYNRALSEAEIKQIYYDSLVDLQLKTNSHSEYSQAIDTGSVSIPCSESDSDIFSLTAYIPNEVTINGVTVRDYRKTVTPFNVIAKVGYTEDTTLISEVLERDRYEIFLKYMPGNDYTTGEIRYTAETNEVIKSELLETTLETNDANAILSYNAGTRTFKISSKFTEGETYNYKIICTKTGAPITQIISDGFGDKGINVYTANANETHLVAAVYTVSASESWDLGGAWSTAAKLIALGLLISAVVYILSTIRRGY